MPNIREYNSTQALQGIRPNELGADALAQSGRRISAVYHEAGEELGRGVATLGQIGASSGGGRGGGGGGASKAQKQAEAAETTTEIAAGAADLSKMTGDLDKEWSDTVNHSDLNDHTIGDKFTTERLEPQLDSFTSQFNTPAAQKWAVQQVDKTREHFRTQITGAMANRAADALGVNADNALNNFSNMARRNPSSMEHAMDTWSSTVDALVGAQEDLDAKAGDKARSELKQKGLTTIAKSTAIGMADTNPDQLLKDIDAGRFDKYLNGDEIKTIQGYAGEAQKNQHAAITQQSQAVSTDYVRQSWDPATQQVKPITPDLLGQVMTDKRLTREDMAGTVKTLKDLYAIQSDPNAAKVSDPATIQSLGARFAGDPSQYPTKEQLGLMLAQRKLSAPDYHIYADALGALDGDKSKQDPVGAELLKGAIKTGHAQLLGSTAPGDTSASDQERVQRFDTWFYPTYQRSLAKGMTPEQLLSPSSQDYLLKPDNMRYFATNGDDLVNSVRQQYGAGAVALPLNPPTAASGAQPKTQQPQQPKKSLGEIWGSLGTQ